MSPASLVERNALWIVPAIPLAFLMVHAMMEFMSGLLADRSARPNREEEAAVRQRLTELNVAAKGYRLVADDDSGFRLEWDVVDPEWAQGFARVRYTQVYTATGFLHPLRHELSYRETIRSGGFFYGWEGRRPRFSTSGSFFAGPMEAVWSGLAVGLLPGWPPRIADIRHFEVDTRIAKNDIRNVLRQAGWGMRPVFWPFETSGRAAQWTAALVPDAVQRLPIVKLWGVLYPLTFAATVGYLVLVIGPSEFDRRDWATLVLVCAAWWGAWGLLARLVLAGGASRRRRE